MITRSLRRRVPSPLSLPPVSDQASATVLAAIDAHRAQIQTAWVAEQMKAFSRGGAMSEGELREQCSEFLGSLRGALSSGTMEVGSAQWGAVRELLTTISRTRAQQGFSPSETALFVLALKVPVYAAIRSDVGDDSARLADALTLTTMVLDRLALFTTEVYQKGREEVIRRQQQDMLELSTPVVSLWNGILALPMIGTLDSSRTQVVMETLLQRIVETGADVAILDITGVPTVDTLTAQHLIKTVTAARLMGAECIISGIRPQIAQTIVHLGVDLGDIVTKATLADAFRVALERRSLAVTKTNRLA